MFNGLEIDLLSIGDADCILITSWCGWQPTRVLVDGGLKSDYGTVRAFLGARNINYIDHLVSTHPHEDHIAGLVELVLDPSIKIGRAWVHMPRFHVDMGLVNRALTKTAALRETRRIRESLRMSQDLLFSLGKRGICVEEPFAGRQIGFLTVCGPTQDYYEELLSFFGNADQIEEIERSTVLQETTDTQMSQLTLLSVLAGMSDSLSDNPQTSPENDSSVILCAVFNGHKYLFTADAGAQALTRASNIYDLKNCNWMQIPHHGSRRNITPALIEHFRPKFAYISACGDNKHPRRAVVNALKKAGSQVFSTHYPSGQNLCHLHGSVPPRTDYGAAFPLWEAPKKSPVGLSSDYPSLLARALGTTSGS